MSEYKNSSVYKNEYNTIVKELTAVGVKKDDAEIVADCFATSDVFGVTTHGISILPSHIDRVKRGGYNLSPSFSIEKETVAFAVINGDNAFGPVAAKFCLDYGVEKCKKV